MNRNKERITIICFLCIGIVCLSIGFAILGSDLEIKGTAKVTTSGWDIHFANLSSVTKTGTAEEITHPTIKANNGVESTLIGDYSVSLKSPKDYIYYTFDIVNEGSYDARIGSINIPTPTCVGIGSNATNDASNVCNNLTYTLTYVDTDLAVSINDTLNKNETKKVKLKLAYADVTKDELPKGNVTISNLQISINYVQSSGSSSGGSTSTEVTRLMYNDGDVVYYDVLEGTTCTNYHEDNSLTGYNGVTTTTDNQTSCLKFYAFNDEGGSTISLLLDHNTTSQIAWNEATSSLEAYNNRKNESNVIFMNNTLAVISSGGYNVKGPKEVIEQLKVDTDSWVETLTPTNYTVSQIGYGDYTIDYSSYKARLITANEIAEITNNTSFNESTTSYSNRYYFDTNSQTESSTYNYGWLYDRLYTCIDYGCFNDESSSSLLSRGYWTSTSTFGSTETAWSISFYGYINAYDTIVSYESGVRPVIEVYKSNL